jgi:hypothetical protein
MKTKNVQRRDKHIFQPYVHPLQETPVGLAGLLGEMDVPCWNAEGGLLPSLV